MMVNLILHFRAFVPMPASPPPVCVFVSVCELKLTGKWLVSLKLWVSVRVHVCFFLVFRDFVVMDDMYGQEYIKHIF